MKNLNNTSSPEKFKSLALALGYLRRHPTRYLFPIRKGAKFPPCLRDNLDGNCSNDPKKIREWSAMFPGCNWAVALKKSRLMVADVDVNPARNKKGQETFDLLDMLYGWPDTEIVTTPSGGHHHYYDGDHVMALGKNGVGLDIDCSPNYVLIPGCMLADGTSYTTNDAPSVACPEWIYTVIRNSKASARISNAGEVVVDLDQSANVELAVDFLKEDAVPAIEGQGSDINTYKTAAYLKDIGISPALALDLMLEHYAPRCSGAFDREWVEKKVAAAYKYTNLSKFGGKTAAADFEDAPETDFEPMGIYDIETKTYKLSDSAELERQRRDREARAVERSEAADAGITLTPKTPRPVVEMYPSRLHEAMDATQAVLIRQASKVKNANGGSKIADQLFQRDGKLVRLSRNLHKKMRASGAVVDADTKLVDGVVVDAKYQELNSLTIVAVKAPWLTTRLTRAIEFKGPSAGKPGAKPKLVPKDVKPNLVNQLIEDSTAWQFPPLFNTIEAPTLRPDGTILDEPGYDPQTGLFFDPGRVKFQTINPNPTERQGRAAMKYLDDELLGSFPFVDQGPDYAGVSKSAAMALMLTAVTRRTFPTAPAFAADSNEPESGKSMLLKADGALMTGREIAGRPFSQSEEERRKALGTAFVEARPFLFFDNVACVVEGASLEMALTSAHFDDRKLGSHEGITAPTNSLMAFSANHLEVGGNGMTTRILVSRLVPDKTLAERKNAGAFKHPLLIPWIIENRPKLIAAVLTALRAFILHGKKDAKPTISRFTEWGSMIGNAMIWYGYPDPTRSGDAIRKADPVHEAMRGVVAAWRQSFPVLGENVTAAMLTASPTVRDAVAAATRENVRDINPLIMSKYVRKLVGVRLGLPCQVTEGGTDGHSKQRRWRLEFTAEERAAVDALM